MNDEYFYFIIYVTNYFIKGQNLNCVYCINQQKNTGAMANDRGQWYPGFLTMNESPLTGENGEIKK